MQCCWWSAVALPAHAALKVLATTPDWGALTTELGGERVNVYVATTALQDVHRVEAKPSLVARARTADLVVATGAELEVGWLPVLIQESGNSRSSRARRATSKRRRRCRLLEVPSKLDRSMGDIHPQGNPHVQLDPHNIAADRARVDGEAHARSSPRRRRSTPRAARISTRAGREAIKRWEAKAAPLKGAQRGDHASRPGLSVPLAGADRSGVDRAEARRAADRGLSRAARHQAHGHAAEADPAQCLQRSRRPPNWLSERVHAPAVVLPFSVGGSPEAKDLFGLFDDTVNKLLAAINEHSAH